MGREGRKLVGASLGALMGRGILLPHDWHDCHPRERAAHLRNVVSVE